MPIVLAFHGLLKTSCIPVPSDWLPTRGLIHGFPTSVFLLQRKTPIPNLPLPYPKVAESRFQPQHKLLSMGSSFPKTSLQTKGSTGHISCNSFLGVSSSRLPNRGAPRNFCYMGISHFQGNLQSGHGILHIQPPQQHLPGLSQHHS